MGWGVPLKMPVTSKNEFYVLLSYSGIWRNTTRKDYKNSTLLCLALFVPESVSFGGEGEKHECYFLMDRRRPGTSVAIVYLPT